MMRSLSLRAFAVTLMICLSNASHDHPGHLIAVKPRCANETHNSTSPSATFIGYTGASGYLPPTGYGYGYGYSSGPLTTGVSSGTSPYSNYTSSSSTADAVTAGNSTVPSSPSIGTLTSYPYYNASTPVGPVTGGTAPSSGFPTGTGSFSSGSPVPYGNSTTPVGTGTGTSTPSSVEVSPISNSRNSTSYIPSSTGYIPISYGTASSSSVSASFSVSASTNSTPSAGPTSYPNSTVITSSSIPLSTGPSSSSSSTTGSIDVGPVTPSASTTSTPLPSYGGFGTSSIPSSSSFTTSTIPITPYSTTPVAEYPPHPYYHKGAPPPYAPRPQYHPGKKE